MVKGIEHCCPNDSQEFKDCWRTITFYKSAGFYFFNKKEKVFCCHGAMRFIIGATDLP